MTKQFMTYESEIKESYACPNFQNEDFQNNKINEMK